MDCRADEGYWCENLDFSGGCVPKGKDWGNPFLPKSCPGSMAGKAQIFQSFSPDDSGGARAEICDAVQQDCLQPAQGMNACYANPTNGSAACIDVRSPGADGDACRFHVECAAGLACHSEGNAALCRPYCRMGGMAPDVACPMGENCVDLGKI